MTRSWGMYGDDMTMELAILTEADASVLKDKVTLTYATQYLGYEERSKIIDFNKSSDKYRIEIKDYSEFNTADDYQAGLTKLNTEIAAGNVPDILNVSGLPIQQYSAKGLLEDLYPYIDADEELNRIWMCSAYTLRLCIRHFLKDKRYNLLEARKVIAAPLYIEHEVSSGQCLRELSCHPCSGCIQFLRYCDGLACIDFTALCIQNGVTVLGNPSVHVAVIPLHKVKSV